MQIVKLINHRNTHTAYLALELLDVCVKNCGFPFHLQIATKEFLNELVKKFPERPPPLPTSRQLRILELLQTWNETFAKDPNLKQEFQFIHAMHQLLSSKGYRFPGVDKDTVEVMAPSDTLRSAVEIEEEDIRIKKAKLQELLRRGGPAELAEANRLMKELSGYEPSVDYKKLEQLNIEAMKEKAFKLESLLQSCSTTYELELGDIPNLHRSCTSAQSKVQYLIESKDDDDNFEAVLQLNDILMRVLQLYQFKSNPTSSSSSSSSTIQLSVTSSPSSYIVPPSSTSTSSSSSSSSSSTAFGDLLSFDTNNTTSSNPTPPSLMNTTTTTISSSTTSSSTPPLSLVHLYPNQPTLLWTSPSFQVTLLWSNGSMVCQVQNLTSQGFNTNGFYLQFGPHPVFYLDQLNPLELKQWTFPGSSPSFTPHPSFFLPFELFFQSPSQPKQVVCQGQCQVHTVFSLTNQGNTLELTSLQQQQQPPPLNYPTSLTTNTFPNAFSSSGPNAFQFSMNPTPMFTKNTNVSHSSRQVEEKGSSVLL